MSARRSACRRRNSSGSHASRTAGTRAASTRSSSCSPTRIAEPARRAGRRSASYAQRSPACRATSPSTRAAWSSRAARSPSSSRSSRPRWRDARCASGTRTRARTPASSRSTCSASGCSRRSRNASIRSSRCTGTPIDLSRIPLDDPGVSPRDPGGGHGRPVPDREPRADAEPPENAAGEPRRPDGAGRARAARADPGKGGASVRPRARAAAAGPVVRGARRSSAARRAAARDARDDHLPGAGARRRGRAGRVQRGGGRGAAARDEPKAERGGDRGLSRALHCRRRRERRSAQDRGARVRQDPRVRVVRLPQVARGRVRAARLPVGVAAAPLSGRVPVRAFERAADGLLSAVESRA